VRGITRLLYAAGLILIMAAASACGSQAESTDPAEILNQESSFSEEAERIDPPGQESNPVEIP